MCFSAQASFIAGSILSAFGVAMLFKAHFNKRLMLLAVIPLLFGIQQLLEGFIWITLMRSDTSSWIHLCSMYGFLVFALAVWPTYIPHVTHVLEDTMQRRQWLSVLCITGRIVSVLSLAGLVFLRATAHIGNHHIVYEPMYTVTWFNYVYYPLFLLYVVATIGSFFVSTTPHMWVLGVLTLTGLVVAQIFYALAFGSVWCFFGALCSIAVWLVIERYQKIPKRVNYV